MKNIAVSELASAVETLRAGEEIALSGTVYTARDAAHKKIMALLAENQPLPFPLQESVLYYAGPTPAPSHLPIGSCGPTTSSRMDPYTPALLDHGLRAIIGKGPRNQAVWDAILRNHAIYLCAIGGAGALAAHSVRSLEVIAFPELGCESIKRLEVENFPLIVAIDACGGNLFQK